MNRKKLLTQLINMDAHIELLSYKLAQFEWNSDQKLIILKKWHIVKILNKFINDLIKQTDTEMWAEAIECHEGIGFEIRHEQLINDILYELANPYLVGELTKDKAKELIEKLT